MTICGADCSVCSFKEGCKGCQDKCSNCIAANYISLGGKAAYDTFKAGLIDEINLLLDSCGMPTAQNLYELPGFFVNLEYPLPGGAVAKMLDDSRIYLGCQIECPGTDLCCGVVADTTFILICTYAEYGTHPQILLYKKR